MTVEEFVRQNDFDREEKLERKPILHKADRRYNHSEKAKACKKRYRQTEHGREVNRRWAREYYRSHSGITKEYRKVYYQQNKERILEKNRRWNELHREEINERSRKPKAFNGWKNRFIKKNGREPDEIEISNWDIKYEDKRRRKNERMEQGMYANA